MDLPDAAAHARSSGLGPRVIYFSLAILTKWPGSSDRAIFFAPSPFQILWITFRLMLHCMLGSQSALRTCSVASRGRRRTLGGWGYRGSLGRRVPEGVHLPSCPAAPKALKHLVAPLSPIPGSHSS
jgi:hypothetical protein